MSGNSLSSAAKYMFLGTQLAVTILAGAFFGKWLDDKFSSSPFLIILCSFTFATVGFYQFIKQTKNSQDDGDSN